MSTNVQIQAQIRSTQEKIFDFLVRRGHVTRQVADSQALSDTKAAVLIDAVRLVKDDMAVAEAAAQALGFYNLSVIEEGITPSIAGSNTSWIVYAGYLCVTNPYDSLMLENATAWARREDIHFNELGVVAPSMLSRVRHMFGDEPDGSDIAVDQTAAMQQFEDFIKQGAVANASDIHLIPGLDNRVDVAFRIDGVLRVQRKIDYPVYETMLRAVLEQKCKLNYTSNVPQDGKFELALDTHSSVSIRLSTIPVVRQSESGTKTVLRLLGNNAALAALDRLGLSASNYEKLVRFGQYPSGMLIMTGPTGSGKTTTLYAQLINMQNTNPNRNLHTIEDPVEMQHTGISNTEVTPLMSFAMALRSMLRQDPDILLVGEMRDNETAELGIKAAMTGHLVLSTLHTNNAHESVGRMETMGVTRDLIASNVTAFMAQRLVRRLCSACKTEHRLSDLPEKYSSYGGNKAFAKAGGDSIVYRKSERGCSQCKGAGEKGRHGILEIMEMTPETQVALIDGINTSVLRRQDIQNGTFEDLWDDGLRLVAEGVVGFEQLEAQLRPYQVERLRMNRN